MSIGWLKFLPGISITVIVGGRLSNGESKLLGKVKVVIGAARSATEIESVRRFTCSIEAGSCSNSGIMAQGACRCFKVAGSGGRTPRYVLRSRCTSLGGSETMSQFLSQ